MTSPRATLLAVLLAGTLTALGASPGQAQTDAATAAERRAAAAEPPPRVYDLKLAIETALRRHPSLAAAEARSQAARSGISSVGAQHRPTLEAHGSIAQRLAGDRNVFFREETASRSVTDSSTTYTTSLGFILPIIREGGPTWTSLPSRDVARAKYDSVKLNERVSRSEIIGNTTVAFFAALGAREEVALTQQLVDLNRVLYDNTRLRFEQQLIAQAEVLAAESAFFSATSELEVARANLAGSLNAFLNSLGVDPSSVRTSELVLVDRDEPMSAVLPLDELLRQVTSSHPAVLVQEAKVREATAALERLRTERYPTVDAVMGIGATDDFSLPVDGWSLRALLRLNWKIFDFGALDLKLKEQADVVLAERSTIEEIRNKLGQPVITAYRNLTGSRSRITAAEKIIELAEELTRATRQRFQQNLVPASDVLRAEANLATARRALIQAKNAVRIDHALLQLALGAE